MPAEPEGTAAIVLIAATAGGIWLFARRDTDAHPPETAIRRSPSRPAPSARRADELAAEGKTGEQIAAELGGSAATLYNWRRQFGGMDTDAVKELKELREQNARLTTATLSG